MEGRQVVGSMDVAPDVTQMLMMTWFWSSNGGD